MKKIKTYIDLKSYEFKENNQIPKIIFRTSEYKLNELPKEILNIYNRDLRLNPEYELFYFDSTDRFKFIEDLGDDRTLKAYDKLIPGSFQSDFFRFSILNKYGGIYMDATFKCYLPLNEVILNKYEVFIKDIDFHIYGMCTAFIATQKNNITLDLTIRGSIYNIENEIYGDNPLTVGGPILLWNMYMKSHYNLHNFDYAHTRTNTVILLKNNEVIMKVRSDNHYNLIYNNNNSKDGDCYPSIRYDSLWKQKSVFKNKRWYEIENSYKNILKRNPYFNEIINYFMSPLSIEEINKELSISEQYLIF